MVFNSAPFFILVTITFILYWFWAKKDKGIQNALLLVASYIFDFSWEPSFLILILLTCTVTLFGAQILEKLPTEKLKNAFFIFLIALVTLPLLFFKYLGFINELIMSVLHTQPAGNHGSTWNLLLPIGISFYTFKTLAYLFEVNSGRMAAERDFMPLSLYISFFPQIMAGPIARPQFFVNQINQARKFDEAAIKDGLLQMLWGLFKKLVLANSLAPFVNYCFNNTATINPAELSLGAAFFYLQLYFDFSGYSDIAIGTAKLFNIQTADNFKYPLFAINISDYWKRWHISLSSWLNDYLFTPMSIHFRYYRKNGLILSILITFFISGIWHGAGLTFIVWGLIHGLLYVPLILKGLINNNDDLVADDQKLPRPRQLFLMLLNFVIISLTLVIFKANTLSLAFGYLFRIFHFTQWHLPDLSLISPIILLLTAAVIVLDWLGKKYAYSLKVIDSLPVLMKYLICYTIVALIVFLGAFENNQFIYNKF